MPHISEINDPKRLREIIFKRNDEIAELMKDVDEVRDEKDLIEGRLNELVSIIVKLFDMGDPSYLHAVMHVENAVKNLRADLAVANLNADTYRTVLEKVVEHARPAFPRSPFRLALDAAQDVLGRSR